MITKRITVLAVLGLASAGAMASPARAQSSSPAIQNIRPSDQRGLNIFEPPKEAGATFRGLAIQWGGAFTQQFQGLSHENAATPNIVNGTDENALMDIGAGFNNATANLDLDVQLAPGIRVALTTYLSSRHHPESWVKDGYLLVDASPIDNETLRSIMEVVTIKLGHFEIDYGDMHYRRTDNGSAMFNPLVGNAILDAFTTQIGAHVYVRKSGFVGMVGMTGGEIRGEIRFPDDRSPAYLAKVGFDRQLEENLRIRLTGSVLRQAKALNNTLYRGDRAGSRYYLVLENTQASTSSQAWSGAINPGFRNDVTAFMLNPFVEAGPFEFFGALERAEGQAANETSNRTWTQYLGEATYRFGADERFYASTRYNRATGTLTGIVPEVSVDRFQLGGGWFVTPNLLLKGEWVTQRYHDFPTTDIRNGGAFEGFVVEGVVSF
jgi:hypothetical protein